jgi:hypothetical protein
MIFYNSDIGILAIINGVLKFANFDDVKILLKKVKGYRLLLKIKAYDYIVKEKLCGELGCSDYYFNFEFG